MPASSTTQVPPQKDPEPPRTYKPVRKYKSEEISLHLLIARARERLAINPFHFQLQAASCEQTSNNVLNRMVFNFVRLCWVFSPSDFWARGEEKQRNKDFNFPTCCGANVETVAELQAQSLLDMEAEQQFNDKVK
ncbi:hypothetical protein B0H13DRAFT_1890136 [Mycena leptocephala]|nr:hypothetical protein B0H13DRAFT_1890136 [Mycena leptocephala]